MYNSNYIFDPISYSKIRVYKGKKYLENSVLKKNNMIAKLIKPPKLNNLEKKDAERNFIPPRKKFLENEIPILISDRNEIICLKKEKDPRTVCFAGQPGSAKTYGLLAMMGRVFKYERDYVFDAQDYQGDTQYIHLPQRTKEFLKPIYAMGETPTAFPSIQIYPMTSNLKKNKEVLNVSSVLPVSDVIDNIEYYAPGAKNSGKYLAEHKDELLKIKSNELFLDYLETQISNKGSKKAIKALFMDMIKMGVVDIEEKTNWRLKVKCLNEYEEYPALLAYLRMGLIPILRAGQVLKKNYYPAYVNYHLEEIFQTQLDKGNFFGRNNAVINIFFDEILKMEYAGKSKENVGLQMIEQIVQQGRPARLGFYYCTQIPSKPFLSNILSSTKYFISTQMVTKEAKIITSLSTRNRNMWARRISDLKSQKYECVLSTNNARYVCYDLLTNSRYECSEPIKGHLIPPLFHTEPPQIAK